MQSKFDLKYIIDMDEWGKLQESLSLVTRMAIIMVDYKGVPVTAHSRCQAFCQTVRSDKEFSAYCQKCDARGGLEAVRLVSPISTAATSIFSTLLSLSLSIISTSVR